MPNDVKSSFCGYNLILIINKLEIRDLSQQNEKRKCDEMKKVIFSLLLSDAQFFL